MKLTGSLEAAVVWVRARRAKVLVRRGKYMMSNDVGVGCPVSMLCCLEEKCASLVF